jgi:hypothetical protein
MRHTPQHRYGIATIPVETLISNRADLRHHVYPYPGIKLLRQIATLLAGCSVLLIIVVGG